MSFKIPPIFKKGLSLVFWALLFLLLGIELWITTLSYRIILHSQETPSLTVTRQVRVDYDGYNKALEKIEHGNVYIPDENSGRSPFGDE